MFQFFSSFGASSDFQRQRLILTTKSYQSPDQISMKKILMTFRGQDEETRSQIAFATIVKKIHTSESKDNWIYLLKNIIILDRVTEENCFLEEIATLELIPIDSYQEINQPLKALNTEKILKSFWRLINQKSKLITAQNYQKNNNYSHINQTFLKVPNQDLNQGHKRTNCFNKISKKTRIIPQKQDRVKSSEQSTNQSSLFNRRSILSVLRSQKQDFLKTLNKIQLMKQAQDIEYLFDLVFKFVWNIDYFTHSTEQKKVLKQNKQLQKINIVRHKQKGLFEYPPAGLNELVYNSSLNSQKNKFIKQQFFNSSLAKYLHLQILYKLISLFTNQLFCIKAFISLLYKQNNKQPASMSVKIHPLSQKLSNKLRQSISEPQILQWKKIIVSFLMNSEKIITYVQRHKMIKGFEMINYKELRPLQSVNIFQMLDEYIEHKNNLEEPEMVEIQQLGNIIEGGEAITVVKKSQFAFEKRLTPRRLIETRRLISENNNNFMDWQNSYQKNFPPKQVLTVDLIMQLRENPNNQVQKDDEQLANIYQSFAANRHSCIYNYRDSNISVGSGFQFNKLNIENKQQGVQLQNYKQQSIYILKSADKIHKKQSGKTFQNIYSSLCKGQNRKNLKWIK